MTVARFGVLSEGILHQAGQTKTLENYHLLLLVHTWSSVGIEAAILHLLADIAEEFDSLSDGRIKDSVVL